MSAVYVLSFLRFLPILSNDVDTARVVVQFTTYPIICHLIADITTNSMDMTFAVYTLYGWATSMLICKVASEWWLSYLIPVELALTSLLVFQFHELYSETLSNKELAMMEVKSTLLSKLFLFTWMGMVQLSWSNRPLT
jgi:hypothetical protein